MLSSSKYLFKCVALLGSQWHRLNVSFMLVILSHFFSVHIYHFRRAAHRTRVRPDKIWVKNSNRTGNATTNQAYSCPRDWRLVAPKGAQLRTPLKPLEHYGSMVSKSLRVSSIGPLLCSQTFVQLIWSFRSLREKSLFRRKFFFHFETICLRH